MVEKRRAKVPQQVVAALEIAQTTRSALIAGIEQNEKHGWDSEVLIYELARTLGLFARTSDIPPSMLEELIEFTRRVYASLASGASPSVEDVLQRLCPGHDIQEDSGDRMAESKVLQ